MPTPILIDTDMGVDDALAIALALAGGGLELAGLVSVGGNVPLDQATGNIGRVLAGLGLEDFPPVGVGLDQTGGLKDATGIFGADGLGETHLAVPDDYRTQSYVEVYERCLERHGEALVIAAIGPLTNLAALLRERPDLLRRAGRIIIMGGAVWCPGNVTRWAEFNFYRDPRAAAEVLSAGLPVTLVPLDVTGQVAMDESHVAHLSRSGRRGGELLARMMRHALERGEGGRKGTVLVHDAVAVGTLLWPELFMRSRVAIEVVLEGEQAGRSRPVVGKDKARQSAVVISVSVVDFLESLLERICQEEFIV
ncbi:MAG: purine nucleosidase [Phycisphaerae bacterium]